MLDALPATRLDPPQQVAAPASDWCQAPSGGRPAWCVVATYPQAERKAHAALHLKGFTAYLPLITTRWADRTWHTAPAFRGYCFVRLDLAKPWHPVTRCPGVFQLLTFDGTKPATCSDAVVEAVREAVDGFDAREAMSPLWQPGAPCTMASGPFTGHSAVVTQVGAEMATVAILMFGCLREVAVQLDCLTQRDE